MLIKHISSACHILTSGDTKILVDPWLEDGEFYGSWFHYPPITSDYDEINNEVDAIYISHIHQDHCSKKTLEKINKDIPIIIHKFAFPFLKRNIESLGFKTIELKHGEPFNVGNFEIEVYAADNCDPELCHKFFGCGINETKMGSTTIDTMAIFKDSQHTLLNVNDCPFLLAYNVLGTIVERHPNIDLLLTGYSGASSFPQCWDLSEIELEKLGKKKEKYYLNNGKRFITRTKPKAFMPFAGKYTLGGKNWMLDYKKYNPSLAYGLKELERRSKYKGFILDSYEEWELGTELPNNLLFEDPKEKDDYRIKIAKKKYDFEEDDMPSKSEIKELLPSAWENYKRKADEMDLKTKFDFYIKLENEWIRVSNRDKKYEVVDSIGEPPYVTMELDLRLLKRILKGPKYAHWNNAEIGSHIWYSRNPNRYERSAYYCMNYFHGRL